MLDKQQAASSYQRLLKLWIILFLNHEKGKKFVHFSCCEWAKKAEKWRENTRKTTIEGEILQKWRRKRPSRHWCRLIASKFTVFKFAFDLFFCAKNTIRKRTPTTDISPHTIFFLFFFCRKLLAKRSTKINRSQTTHDNNYSCFFYFYFQAENGQKCVAKIGPLSPGTCIC